MAFDRLPLPGLPISGGRLPSWQWLGWTFENHGDPVDEVKPDMVVFMNAERAPSGGTGCPWCSTRPALGYPKHSISACRIGPA